jgi:hypothetical protein
MEASDVLDSEWLDAGWDELSMADLYDAFDVVETLIDYLDEDGGYF